MLCASVNLIIGRAKCMQCRIVHVPQEGCRSAGSRKLVILRAGWHP